MLQAKNVKIFHYLQSLLTKPSLANLSLLGDKVASSASKSLLPPYQVFICWTYILLRLHQFRDHLESRLAHKCFN